MDYFTTRVIAHIDIGSNIFELGLDQLIFIFQLDRDIFRNQIVFKSFEFGFVDTGENLALIDAFSFEFYVE
jgi:hypothetical protein